MARKATSVLPANNNAAASPDHVHDAAALALEVMRKVGACGPAMLRKYMGIGTREAQALLLHLEDAGSVRRSSADQWELADKVKREPRGEKREEPLTATETREALLEQLQQSRVRWTLYRRGARGGREGRHQRRWTIALRLPGGARLKFAGHYDREASEQIALRMVTTAERALVGWDDPPAREPVLPHEVWHMLAHLSTAPRDVGAVLVRAFADWADCVRNRSAKALGQLPVHAESRQRAVLVAFCAWLVARCAAAEDPFSALAGTPRPTSATPHAESRHDVPTSRDEAAMPPKPVAVTAKAGQRGRHHATRQSVRPEGDHQAPAAAVARRDAGRP